jgi:hypothetical protein
MARAYYSTVFDNSAARVWALLRDFGNYRLWIDEVEESGVEEGKSGDAVGAVRYARIGETQIRQRLLAHSDVERSYSYEFCGAPRFPIRNFVATLRVTPVTDGDRAFVESWASYDCEAAEQAHWEGFLVHSFAGWLESLRGRTTSPQEGDDAGTSSAAADRRPA